MSLGNFIFFGHEPSQISIGREYGHQIQSLYLGWFYLLVIGLPSFIGCIWDILFRVNWSNEKRIDWYYHRFPENWADSLGGVQRYL